MTISELLNTEEDYIIPDSLNIDLDVSNLLNAENNETIFSPEKCFSINLGEAIWRPKFKKKDEFLSSDSNDLAFKILEYRQNLKTIKQERLTQLGSYLQDKLSQDFLLTPQEENILKVEKHVKNEDGMNSVEKEYFNRFLGRLNEEKELTLESIISKVQAEDKHYDFSTLNLRDILVRVNGRNQPNKKIAQELTKPLRKPALSKDSRPSTSANLDKVYIRSIPGLFSLLRMILVRHEAKRNEAKANNPNSRMTSLTIAQIIDRVNQWQSNEDVRRLNALWINKTSDWCVYVEAALKFLTADPSMDILSDKEETPVCSRPFVEFKNRTQNCTWITVMNKNYDDDIAMEERKKISRMYPEWFKFAHKHHKTLQSHFLSSKSKNKNQDSQNNSNASSNNIGKNSSSTKKNSRQNPSINQNGKAPPSDSIVEEDIPPCPNRTDWVVQTSTPEERLEFQRQESERFSKPWMPYVYRQHDYISVVGPLRSYLRQSDPSSLAGMKPRSHPLLRNDRPPIVGLADIVRDAVARLPNGEGTRTDIVVLAMDSSFLISKFDEKQLHQCISGALDRLQCEPDTPVVYRQSRRVWIYKHRHRTPEDFLEIYQTQKNIQAKKKELKRIRPMSGHIDEGYENSKMRRLSTDVSSVSTRDLGDSAPTARRVYKSHKVSNKAFSNSMYDRVHEDIPDIDDLLNSNDPDLDSCRSSSRAPLDTYENSSPSIVYNRNQNYAYSRPNPHIISVNGGRVTSGISNAATVSSSPHQQQLQRPRPPTTIRVHQHTPNTNLPQGYQGSSSGPQQPVQYTKVKTITIPHSNTSSAKTVTPVYIRKLTK